jgi:zinc finger HIT domain-containing protein 3
MAQKCGVCHIEDSKYKCPVCEMRYCSLACYKLHKPTHEGELKDQSSTTTQPKKDRPGTKQRVPKPSFQDFEQDIEFQRLLQRYPLLKLQLQTIYGLTIEPGPEDSRTWNKQPLPSLPGYEIPTPPPPARGRGSYRGRGGRGNRRGGRGHQNGEDEREYGRWTQEKGDREALKMLAKMRVGDGKDGDDVAEGMRDFIELVGLRFGEKDRV